MDNIFPAFLFPAFRTGRWTVCNRHFWSLPAVSEGLITSNQYARMCSFSPWKFVHERVPNAEHCCVSVFTAFWKLPSMGCICCVTFELSCMGRHPFSSLKSSKGCDEAVSLLSSKTFLTQHWKNTAYTLLPCLTGVGVWVRWRWECVSCKAWIMQTLKKGCSALPRALELSSLSSYVMVITTFCPVTIISCPYLCFPLACARAPSCAPRLPTLECCVTAKLPCRTVKSITCMNQVIISILWDSLVFGAQAVGMTKPAL